ncbi:MAG: hypothetical protein WDO74_27740 [Pseudomonadota bacterium]
MNLDDDDSVFEQALRADLPTMSEQNRLRQRILAAGLVAGTALGSTNVAAAQVGFGASALSKLSALSWPAKFGLAAVLAAPIAALPLVSAPVPGAQIVSQVRSSAATVRARSATKAPHSGANSLPLEAPQTSEPKPEPEPVPVPANAAGRAPVLSASNLPTPGAPNPLPSLAANGNAVAAAPAVAAFDSLAHAAPASEPQPSRNASTLAVETQLLDRAFAALARGDRSTASALVAEHARRFPSGLLRQERESARARLAQDPKGE